MLLSFLCSRLHQLHYAFPLGRSKTPRCCCYKNKVSRWMNKIKKKKKKALDNWKGKSIKPAREQLNLIRNFVVQFYMLSFGKSSFISIPWWETVCLIRVHVAFVYLGFEREKNNHQSHWAQGHLNWIMILLLDYDPSLASEKWRIKSLTRTMFFFFLINWALH
jgi:hypothetical protein